MAAFTADATEVFAGETIQFTNASANATSYLWDFGDGGSSLKDSPSYTFEDDGRYEVKLIARGEESTDTASLDIEVFWPYNVTIFEGSGIENVFINDTWATAESVFSSDTAYFKDYITSLEGYRHIVYYPDEGIAYFFFNEDTLINNDDPLAFILIIPPYIGGTTKGVGLVSTMKRVTDSYGEPEDIDEGNGFKGYWYDSQGVDFYTYSSGYVEEIYIYEKAAKKKTAFKQQLLRGTQGYFKK